MTRFLQILAGLLIGVAIAEGVFWFRDDGAFPHLNLYVEDKTLGVRLMPNESERVRFGGNEISRLTTNARGYRGANWSDTAPNAIAVVGDSQVFGLGVNDDETFCARLAALTGRPVLNAGVPTYGPPEFLQIAREVMAREHPKTMILTINMVNDLFEIKRKNVDRHRVWDGWAVRLETAPSETTWFPLRDFAMRKSHLVYAMRRLVHEKSAATIGALPSEGSWKDLDALNEAQVDDDGKTSRDAMADTFKKRVDDEDNAARDMSKLMAVKFGEIDDSGEPSDLETTLLAARGNPGDIVAPGFVSESARPVDFGAVQLLRASRRLAAYSDALRITPDVQRRAVEEREALRRKAVATNDKPLVDSVNAYDKSLTRLAELRREPVTFARIASPLNGVLEEFASICHAPECEPMVLVLPIDLAVSPEEWTKYDLSPHDISSVNALAERIVHSAAAMGIRHLDALPVLKAAEPSAFLKNDIHMTAKGHASLAIALADELAKPAPLAPTTGALPPGRTRVPTAEEFRRTPEILFGGSGKAGCETVVIDEWFRAQCRKGPGNDPRHVVLTSGSRDSFTTATPDAMTLIAPVLPGSKVEADFVWANRSQHLTAERHSDGRIIGGFATAIASTTPRLAMSKGAAALCECMKLTQNIPDCADVYGSTAAECAETYLKGTLDAASCVHFVECAQGFPASLPMCARGSTIAGGTLQCFAQCSSQVPCASGTCENWPETGVCLGGP